jgi:ERCC4-type nuclease
MDATQTAVRIIADDRENAGGVIAALRELAGVNVEVRRLTCGDYLVENKFTVERKTLRDFAGSIVDHRVFRQAAVMAQSRRRGVLVLEGAGSDLQAIGVQREALQGALIHISVFRGLAILRSHDPGETARLMVYLGRQAQAWAHGSLSRPGYRPKGRRARQLFLLQGLPSIGPGRAVRLLDRFGSVQAVAAATAAELATVDGIGDGIAARIRWALGAEEVADNPKSSKGSCSQLPGEPISRLLE